MRRELPRISVFRRAGLVALLATTMAASGVSAAEPAAQGSSVVVVDVDASLDRAQQVRERITSDAETVLREHDVATTIDPKAPRTLTIDVGGERYAYEIELVVERSGKADAPVRLRCECNYDELFAKVSEGVRDSVPALQRASESAAPPSTPPSTNDGEPEQPPVMDDREGPAPLGGLGKAGIATMVVGVAGLGAGIALAVVGERERESVDSSREVEATNFAPPGYALIGVGAAALVTGVVLLAVDRRRAKRNAALVPIAGPRFVGWSFTGRF